MKKSVSQCQSSWLEEPLYLSYKELSMLPAFKVVLEDLKVYANSYRSSFVPGDPYMTVFQEGQRDLLLHILACLECVEKSQKLSSQSVLNSS